MKKNKVFLSILFMLTISFAFSQSNDSENDNALDNGSIDSQFEYVLDKSTRYTSDRGVPYKVIRLSWMNKIKQNVADSLNKVNNTASSLQNTINKQKNEIDGLNKQLQTTTDDLKNVTDTKDSISFFGANWSKGTYKTLMWAIIVILASALIFFIYKYRSSNVITHEARQNLAEIEAEYEDHRRKSLEREQKVRRELQDLINERKNSKKS